MPKLDKGMLYMSRYVLVDTPKKGYILKREHVKDRVRPNNRFE